MSAPAELVLVGAGLRGARSYGPVAREYPEELRFVAVVEPNAERRALFARTHDIPAARRFSSVEEWLATGTVAQGAVVATPDRSHVGPAVAALESGHDVLLEKPLAPTPAECLALVACAERCGRRLHVGHVLRYTPFFRTLHDIVASGELGELVSVEHRENVASWHMAHSYVRGAYGDTGRSSPFLLAKCCHDLDLIGWNLDRPVVSVSSFGSLLSFSSAEAPPGAPARCTDGCPVEDTCPYSAPHVYLGEPDGEGGWRPVTPFSWLPLTDHGDWDRETGSLTESTGERLEALRTGPYGRCVYRCGNDAVDHQVVSMELSGGATAVLIVHGHSTDDERTVRYDGTLGSVTGRFGDFTGSELTVHSHRSGAHRSVSMERVPGLHGGGDVGIMRAFAASVRQEGPPGTEARGALAGHLLGFAAERARWTGSVVDVGSYLAEVGMELPGTASQGPAVRTPAGPDGNRWETPGPVA